VNIHPRIDQRFISMNHELATTSLERSYVMLSHFTDLDNAFTLLTSRPILFATHEWPPFSLHDEGPNLVLSADLPGCSSTDVAVTLHGAVLTVSGERKVSAPEGYFPHRRERRDVKLSRSITLPAKVDADKVSASMKNGVLTIVLAKTAEAQSRHIPVKAQ
jgi:HSP20 family protein